MDFREASLCLWSTLTVSQAAVRESLRPCLGPGHSSVQNLLLSLCWASLSLFPARSIPPQIPLIQLTHCLQVFAQIFSFTPLMQPLSSLSRPPSPYILYFSPQQVWPVACALGTCAPGKDVSPWPCWAHGLRGALEPHGTGEKESCLIQSAVCSRHTIHAC